MNDPYAKLVAAARGLISVARTTPRICGPRDYVDPIDSAADALESALAELPPEPLDYPPVVWRGSVTDLAPDLRPLLDEDDRKKLARELHPSRPPEPAEKPLPDAPGWWIARCLPEAGGGTIIRYVADPSESHGRVVGWCGPYPLPWDS